MLGGLTFDGIFAVFGPWIITFTLISVRVGALFLTTPALSMQSIPMTIKGAIVAILCVLAMSTMNPSLELAALTPLQLVAVALVEAVVGGVMGLAVMMFFAAVSFTGNLIGIQMGFAIANVVDPSTNQQNGILSQVLNLMALALFITLDGHIVMLQALFQSFDIIPLGAAAIQTQPLMGELITMGSDIFSLGLKMGLPVICVVLLVNVGLATLARTVPQVNIFVLGFLITISIGLLILGMAMPSLGQLFQRLMLQSIEAGVGLLKYF